MKLLFLLLSFVFPSEIGFGPYINAVTDSSAIIKYGFKRPSISWVSWGISPKCDMYMTFFAPQKSLTLPLYALQPGKEYCYRIYLPIENSTFSYIASSSTFMPFNISSTSSFSFVVFTDLNSGYSYELDNLLKKIMEDNIMFSVYYGSMTKTDNGYYQFFSRYAYFIKKIPFYIPVIEHNFDYQTSFAVKDFARFFYFSYHGNSPYYYYFDNSNARFVFVDLIKSSQSPRFLADQLEWLEKTLSSNKKDWLFIILNDSLFSSNLPGIKKISQTIIKSKPDFIIQYGNKTYRREKIYYDDSHFEAILITIGEKQILNYDEIQSGEGRMIVSEFETNEDGVLKISVDSLKTELGYFNLDIKKLDSLVYQR
ncbi:MAG: metallophosphoesterase family protein [Elusimicrobiales bacterium]